jgi:hypothetical protein
MTARTSPFVSLLLRATADIAPGEAEYRFAPPRRWRFDIAWPTRRVALEIDGGIWTGGRHTFGAGWLRDAEKLNEAAARGWRVLHCTPQQARKMEVLDILRRALEPGEDLDPSTRGAI